MLDYDKLHSGTFQRDINIPNKACLCWYKWFAVFCVCCIYSKSIQVM